MNSRKDPVVVDVIPVVARLGSDDELLQPLYTSPTDLPWNDRSKWHAVIGTQHFAIHAVSEHHATVRVHGPVQLDRSTVVAVRLGKLAWAQRR
jgi:hypothetical protein